MFLVVSREIDSNQGWLINACTNKESVNTDHNSVTYIEDNCTDLTKMESKEFNENEKSIDNKNSR